MKKWKCKVCGYIYDEAKERIPIHPGRVIQALKKQVAKDALICVDVGDHTLTKRI